MERDVINFSAPFTHKISTHTLTWSVTVLEIIKIEDYGIISTHTLTWSVTNEPYKIMIKDYHFNSHAHVERDWKVQV